VTFETKPRWWSLDESEKDYVVMVSFKPDGSGRFYSSDSPSFSFADLAGLPAALEAFLASEAAGKVFAKLFP